MFFNKIIQKRNTVIRPCQSLSILIYILTGWFSLFIEDHLRSNAISIIAVIIAQIVKRKNKCFFVRRKHNFGFFKFYIAILILRLFHHVTQANQHVPSVIHRLIDLVELTDCRHPHIKLSALRSRKSTLRIYDKRVVEYMRHLIQIDFHQRFLRFFIFRNSRLHLLIRRKIRLTLQQFNGTVVIILLCHQFCLLQHIGISFFLLLYRFCLLFFLFYLFFLIYFAAMTFHYGGYTDNSQKQSDYTAGRHFQKYHPPSALCFAFSSGTSCLPSSLDFFFAERSILLSIPSCCPGIFPSAANISSFFLHLFLHLFVIYKQVSTV